ncbi:lariat debranching enzyme [Phlebotomus argentipes]|uniref:lariat debranching enzyme n=1 Tax=Phlebotomus argentipes TaxID=94469 RepID=UPI0028933327|nr:lariat debranching enzyme [Phlebotomus argentipes]
MKIAVEGCAHGELEKIYDTIAHIESEKGIKVDLLICCGDFQSTRNLEDLNCMAVPPKYRDICTFYKYYSGEKTAPILTIFIGGNHEASNYLQELPYGGWVAPKIYYLGYAGVISVAGIRIAGLSGIYKSHDYHRGHFEMSPYTDGTVRSVYHIRNLEVFRLKQLSGRLDICLSHDWPRGIYHHGNAEQLMRFKPFFREEIERNSLGNETCEELLNHLKPDHWFSAHLHCKFSAVVKHEEDRMTKFLALDKCLPRRRFLQILDIPSEGDLKLHYDLEWLTILALTNHLLSVKHVPNYMPGPGGAERFSFTPTEEEKTFVQEKFSGNLEIPENFVPTVVPFDPSNSQRTFNQPQAEINPQTTLFCDTMGIDDPLRLLMMLKKQPLNLGSAVEIPPRNDESICTGEDEDEEEAVPEEPPAEEENDTFVSFSTTDNLMETSSENVSVTPPVKRFRGRNQALYNAPEES